jgi:CBS domain-containing protein
MQRLYSSKKTEPFYWPFFKEMMMLAKITIADYMTKHLVTVHEDTPVFTAIQKLLDHRVTSAPVLDKQGHLVGMFSEKDGMKVVLECAYNQSMSGTVGEFMSRDVVTVEASASIVDLAERFENTTVRSYPVFENNELVGLVSRTDVLRALVSAKVKEN